MDAIAVLPHLGTANTRQMHGLHHRARRGQLGAPSLAGQRAVLFGQRRLVCPHKTHSNVRPRGLAQGLYRDWGHPARRVVGPTVGVARQHLGKQRVTGQVGLREQRDVGLHALRACG